MRIPTYTLIYHNISTEGYASYAQEYFDNFDKAHVRMAQLGFRGIICELRPFRKTDWILYRGHVTEEDYDPNLKDF